MPYISTVSSAKAEPPSIEAVDAARLGFSLRLGGPGHSTSLMFDSLAELDEWIEQLDRARQALDAEAVA